MHSAVLTVPGTVSIRMWTKDATTPNEQENEELIRNLDPCKDVVLFPATGAIVATEFPWHNTHTFSTNITTSPQRWRLVVLEASWHHGKSMARRIVEVRRSLGLPAMTFVSLPSDAVGEYWRFHEEGEISIVYNELDDNVYCSKFTGHSSVSTIEAINHAAVAASLSAKDSDVLLTLFRLQKYRVLSTVNQGGKVPRAIEVSGDGEGSWRSAKRRSDFPNLTKIVIS